MLRSRTYDVTEIQRLSGAQGVRYSQVSESVKAYRLSRALHVLWHRNDYYFDMARQDVVEREAAPRIRIHAGSHIPRAQMPRLVSEKVELKRYPDFHPFDIQQPPFDRPLHLWSASPIFQAPSSEQRPEHPQHKGGDNQPHEQVAKTRKEVSHGRILARAIVSVNDGISVGPGGTGALPFWKHRPGSWPR